MAGLVSWLLANTEELLAVALALTNLVQLAILLVLRIMSWQIREEVSDVKAIVSNDQGDS